MANVQAALEMINTADLSSTEHLLLRNLVNSAVYPEDTARLITSTIETSNCSVETSLREVKRQWRKLASRLMASDKIPQALQDLAFERDGRDFTMRRGPSHVPGSKIEPAFIVPPSMIHDLESVEQGALLRLLRAFLSDEHVNYLKKLLTLEPQDTATRLRNIVLLPPSIHAAFRAGHVDIRTRNDLDGGPPPGCVDETLLKCRYAMRTQYPEEVSGLFLGDGTPFRRGLVHFDLSTADPERLPLPSSLLIDVHFRFAAALHLFYIEDKAARGWSSASLSLSLPSFVRRSLTWLWLTLPECLRVACYLLLNRIGRKLYPLDASVWAQRLPFGLYMKQCIRAPQNEPNVLRLIERQTSIPAPRLIDTWERDGTTYILMTRIPGDPIEDVQHLLSYSERREIADDIARYVAQLRQIPNNTPYLICDSLGGPIVDHRIPSGTGGPWHTEAEFYEHLTSHYGPMAKVAELKKLGIREHEHFYFTHSDLHPSNLLVERGRLTGIVDWESAGFRPEYWEFTKAMYGAVCGGGPVMDSIFWRAFGRKYERELEVERQLWYITPFGS
ncbi:kinase-like protein [Aspergillus homomorphus CBS 101889]|uniref:Kinase-like protein n=1 Tax=Aspergillus homomorphus (strain CBS 101889) TaxID=1450537 RepID=A0A395HZX4_ASPHC|nr:kinase-like protein [Aspergillus homomorphus CBS 101889]RAL11824.1 kinase-like protein [Aspergillus homomorphus CBS 101889]